MFSPPAGTCANCSVSLAGPMAEPGLKGDRLVQPDLAKTLRKSSPSKAPDAFYRGAIAELLASEMKAGGGLITRDDLAAYQALARQPTKGSYRGYDVYAPPPPSSGGICLVEMLNILENYDLKKHKRFGPRNVTSS